MRSKGVVDESIVTWKGPSLPHLSGNVVSLSVATESLVDPARLPVSVGVLILLRAFCRLFRSSTASSVVDSFIQSSSPREDALLVSDSVGFFDSIVALIYEVELCSSTSCKVKKSTLT